MLKSKGVQMSILVNKYIVRLTEITIQISSGVSTLIRQHIALIDNFDLRFMEFR